MAAFRLKIAHITCLLDPEAPKNGGTAESYEAWENLNAFTARLFNTEYAYKPFFPFVTLTMSLEEDLAWKKDTLDCEIVAAAQWILIGGRKIRPFFRAGAANLSLGSRQVLQSRKYPIDCSDMLPKERWMTWQARFQECPEFDISPKAKEQAARAAQMMEDLWVDSSLEADTSLTANVARLWRQRCHAQ